MYEQNVKNSGQEYEMKNMFMSYPMKYDTS